MKKQVEEYLAEIKEIADNINIEDIARVVTTIYGAWSVRGDIYVCGNGGSAATASHFTSDLCKIGVGAYCLNDNMAQMTALTNDVGWDNVFLNQLAYKWSRSDVLICISVHGGVGEDKAGQWSQNITKAVDYVKRYGGKVIGLVGFDGGVLKQLADASIVVGHSTPQVESWHNHICHLICEILKVFKPVRSCADCGFIHDGILCTKCGCVHYTHTMGIKGNIQEIMKIGYPEIAYK